MADYLLSESPIGYAVYKVNIGADAIGTKLREVQESVQDLARFGKMVELVGIAPFQGTEQALNEINDVSEGIMSDYLKAHIETTLPKAGKKKSITLGVSERNLAGSIRTEFPNLSLETPETSEAVGDLLRGIRQHSAKLIKQLQSGDLERSILGLGHAYSRSKVKFNVAKNDNHIIQSIAQLDVLSQDVNQFSMRLREIYGWHFPELSKIVSDHDQYAKLVLAIGDKSRLSDDDIDDLANIVDGDEGTAKAIVQAARVSMGRDLSEQDMEIAMQTAKRASSLASYRKSLTSYLASKMNTVAPNLAALIGDTVGARLISKAGSLTNLSKYPASTVQILGAEKALFRALKTKGATPKYGLIYHSSFIGRTGTKSKGRISRFLANKCSIAARIDNFSDTPTSKFGEALRRQVDERIDFYATGAPPAKNSAVMQAAMNSVMADIDLEDPTAGAAEDVIMADGVTAKATEQALRKEKKDKKEKKKKSKHAESDAEEVSEKKSKKEKKRKHGEDDGESKKKKKKSKA